MTELEELRAKLAEAERRVEFWIGLVEILQRGHIDALRVLARGGLTARPCLPWKALAKKLWRSPYPNRGGTGRYGCAAIDVRMRRHGK